MHDYAVDSSKRIRVNQILVAIYILMAVLASWIGGLSEKWILEKLSLDADIMVWNFVTAILSIVFSGLGIGVVYYIHDYFLWKCFTRWHGIPNLNGKWIATVESSLKGSHKPEIDMEIKQTWNKIQVRGESKNKTKTVSQSAYIIQKEGQTFFGYSYLIYQKNGQCYPGFNVLCYQDGKLSGDYFSGKDINRDMEAQCLKDMKLEGKDKKLLKKKLKGCGSKGRITFCRKES